MMADAPNFFRNTVLEILQAVILHVECLYMRFAYSVLF